MGAIDRSVATLPLFGDDLVPDEISTLLGVSATKSCRKSQELIGSSTGVVRIAKTGSWRLSAVRREPEDLEAQIFEILGQLTQDLNVWESPARYEPDVFCGPFMGSSNDGLPLSAKRCLPSAREALRWGWTFMMSVTKGPALNPDNSSKPNTLRRSA